LAIPTDTRRALGSALQTGGLGPHGFDAGVMRILHDKVLLVEGGSCTPSPVSRASEADGWCASGVIE